MNRKIMSISYAGTNPVFSYPDTTITSAPFNINKAYIPFKPDYVRVLSMSVVDSQTKFNCVLLCSDELTRGDPILLKENLHEMTVYTDLVYSTNAIMGENVFNFRALNIDGTNATLDAAFEMTLLVEFGMFESDTGGETTRELKERTKMKGPRIANYLY